ncbi:hypothetical protein M3Y97_00539500 [Aphelenchoides bicaudatus]|nr:hypothetical protein M3Y97_00539500 [Aphelenchoides bicaudatus]
MAQQPTKEQQKILAGFKKLREEQQGLIGDIQRYAGEIRETQNVLKTIDKWENNEGRKFYYRTVDALLEMDNKTIIERLTNNVNELEQKLKKADEDLKTKGSELQEYTQKHQIKIVAQ